MLRHHDDLVRFLRRRSPGRREQLAFRLLHSIVLEPTPRVAPARAKSPRPKLTRELPGYKL
jgi:hypothetical protein